MKNSILLLLCAVGVAALAWALLHYLDQDAFSVLSSVLLISLAVDNYRLRRAMAKSRKPLVK